MSGAMVAAPAAAAGTEESHDTLWASMKTVVVQDCTPDLSPQRQAPLEDSPASTPASSSGSSTPDSGGDASPRLVVVNGLAAAADDLASDPLAFSDLFGDGGEEEAEVEVTLHSVEEAQFSLDNLLTLRTKIKAISAKYSPPKCREEGALETQGATLCAQESEPQCTEEGALPTDGGEKPKCVDQIALPGDGVTVKANKDVVAFAPPARPAKMFSGPGARPETSDVKHVFQQLATRLQEFKDTGAAAEPDAPCPTSPPSSASGKDGGRGFTIGGAAVPASTLAAETAPVATLGRLAGGQAVKGAAVDDEKLRAATESEEKSREEMWHSFLAGDDRPVGCDGLPPPEAYYG